MRFAVDIPCRMSTAFDGYLSMFAGHTDEPTERGSKTEMDRRRALSLALVAVVVSVAVTGVWLWFPLPGNQTPESTPEIVLDPFNKLDWWDIAWQLGMGIDFLHCYQTIANCGPRFDGTAGYELAAKWIIDQLKVWGVNASFFGAHRSVLGYQKGYGNDSRALVLGAHLDSAESGMGVDQNAGGCGVVMMIARILSQFRLPVDIYYCFFAGNMEFIDPNHWIRALYGSKEILQYLVAQGAEVIAFYNYDELLYHNPVQEDYRCLLAEHESESLQGYQTTKYLADLLISFMRRSGPDIMLASRGTYTQTDHLSFLAAGFPSVNIKSGHTYDPEMPPSDRLGESSYDTTQAILVARASASAAVYLAMRGNGEISRQRMEQSVSPFANATLGAVMTVPQKVELRGSTSKGSSLAVTITNGTSILLPMTQLPVGNFSMESDYVCPLGILTVTVLNQANKTSDVTLYLEYASDTDGNGILDSVQYSWPPPDPPLDWDRDGLSDKDEIGNSTDVFRPDTDNDDMGDAIEVRYGLDPLRDDSREDPDGDGLSNIREIGLGTNPTNSDTDTDGMPDNWEVEWGLNALIDDSALDSDNDTLANIQEYQHGSDPLSPDGDHDGVPDTVEVERGMNPLSSDSDNDLLRDQLELLERLDPLFPDCDYDLLVDGNDSNPHINNVSVIALLVLLPFALGSILIERRVHH